MRLTTHLQKKIDFINKNKILQYLDKKNVLLDVCPIIKYAFVKPNYKFTKKFDRFLKQKDAYIFIIDDIKISIPQKKG